MIYIKKIFVIVQDALSTVGRQLKWQWQRIYRGWDDRDLWSLDTTVMKFLYPRLKVFTAHERVGIPHTMFTNDKTSHEEASAKWQMILECMLAYVKDYADDNLHIGSRSVNKQVKQGEQYFKTYFTSLWD